jgi:hypothetical protein
MNPMEPRSARQEQEVSEGYGFRTVQDVSGRITQTRIRNQQVLGSIPSAGSCIPSFGGILSLRRSLTYPSLPALDHSRMTQAGVPAAFARMPSRRAIRRRSPKKGWH